MFLLFKRGGILPETKSEARKRAKAEGFPMSSVVQSDDGGWFIAPHGITSSAAKEAYANCRADGGDKEKCAKIAWSVQEKAE